MKRKEGLWQRRRRRRGQDEELKRPWLKHLQLGIRVRMAGGGRIIQGPQGSAEESRWIDRVTGSWPGVFK